MTTIQKQLSRKIGEKEYAKWVLVIPPNIIKKSGMKEGTSVYFTVREGKIVIQNKNNSK